tara:strand:+ start:1194 stop:1577 length:384 start_codon:yes stop_codon:yes gene_type:complete
MFTTGMVAAQSNYNPKTNYKKPTEYIYYYEDVNWNECQLREAIIRMCSNYLNKNGHSIFKPEWQAVEVSFKKCDIVHLLSGQCPRFVFNEDEHITMRWCILKEDSKKEVVVFQITRNSIKYTIDYYK